LTRFAVQSPPPSQCISREVHRRKYDAPLNRTKSPHLLREIAICMSVAAALAVLLWQLLSLCGLSVRDQLSAFTGGDGATTIAPGWPSGDPIIANVRQPDVTVYPRCVVSVGSHHRSPHYGARHLTDAGYSRHWLLPIETVQPSAGISVLANDFWKPRLPRRVRAVLHRPRQSR